MPRNSTSFDTAASLLSGFSVPSQSAVRPDARLQFHDCFPAPLLYLTVITVGVKCMLNSAHSFNGKAHRLLSRVGRRWMEDEGLTNCLLLNTPATTSRSSRHNGDFSVPRRRAGPRGDREFTIIASHSLAKWAAKLCCGRGHAAEVNCFGWAKTDGRRLAPQKSSVYLCRPVSSH